MISKVLLSVASVFSIASASHSILDYGAIPDLTDTDTAYANAYAFNKAIEAANAGTSADRVVLVPANYTFTLMPVHVDHLYNFVLTINGTILASEDNINWENRTETECWDLFTINDSTNITINGEGVVDGQGFRWWMREYAQTNIAERPKLVKMHRVVNCEITGAKW
mmetsp:Transcript_35007/g.25488  ORF Transcript_35007/g.25488 Transcript_35007/m.25488 type:complete len:167 (-) Transcript_35007:1197-1697(-)